MDRIQSLWEHPLYQEHFQKLQESEARRVFCRHTLSHFLDVARLTYIYSLESDAGLDRELIYAAALLHDIGRWQQITEGIPHDRAGAALAGRILPECGFGDAETAVILSAILHHRTRNSSSPDGNPPAYYPEASLSPAFEAAAQKLSALLRRADKRCRCCFACSARDKCNWSEEQKNHQITL